MKVGWIGLGKLGLPCALVLAQYHEVWGYDVSSKPWQILSGSVPPMQEEGIEDLLSNGSEIKQADSVAEVVSRTDIVFVAVQTPHDSRFGGESLVTAEPEDFEYAYLVDACRQVCRAAELQRKNVVLTVVSTVLPGTTDRLIRPLLNEWVNLVYSPQFIAMGTTIDDFTDPEFVICGSDENTTAADWLDEAMFPVHGDSKLFRCDIVTAESIKVFYNTFISMKIVWANHVMEMCHKTGADCDRVVDALSLATDRVVSPKYMRGGMGDGGACHPRDLIALSWLENRLGMTADLFGYLARARETQTGWLASVVRHYARMTGHQVVILGRAYKPGSDLTAGSPAILLRDYLSDLHPWQFDSYTGNEPAMVKTPGTVPYLYVIAAKHPEYVEFPYRPRSVVIDPFGYVEDRDDITVIRIGRH